MMGEDMSQADASADVFDSSVRAARARFQPIEGPQIEALIASQPGVTGPVTVSNVKTLLEGAGMSNGIAFFEASFEEDGKAQSGRFVLRYDPGVSLIAQKLFGHEFLTIRAAENAGLPVPHARYFDKDGSYLGRPGFVMDRIEAEAPSMSLYLTGPLADVTPDVRKQMLLAGAELHGTLRKAAIQPEAVPHLLERGKGATPIERELNWWLEEGRIAGAEKLPEWYAAVGELREWLLANQPALRPATLAHGDGQIANIMYRDQKPVAWLDWELSNLGYQECDLMMLILACDLTRPADREIEGIPTEAEFVAAFEKGAGAPVEEWTYQKITLLYRYLAGVIFSAHLIPNVQGLWDVIVGRINANWPEGAERPKFLG